MSRRKQERRKSVTQTKVFVGISIVGIFSVVIILYGLTLGNPANREKKMTDELMAYGRQLQTQTGFLYRSISYPTGKIDVLVPNGGEVAGGEAGKLLILIRFAASQFGQRNRLVNDDIVVDFKPPVSQQIIFINRTIGLPEHLQSASESTVLNVSPVVSETQIFSFVNLAGPYKTPGREFSVDWSVIQAVCLGFTVTDEDSDAKCNIISANAAAGWTKIDRKAAQDLLNNFGTTSLAYLGKRDFRYRFIPEVYDVYFSGQ